MSLDGTIVYVGRRRGSLGRAGGRPSRSERRENLSVRAPGGPLGSSPGRSTRFEPRAVHSVRAPGGPLGSSPGRSTRFEPLIIIFGRSVLLVLAIRSIRLPCGARKVGSGAVTCGFVRGATVGGSDDPRSCASLVYLLLRQILQLLIQLARDDGAK